MLGSLIQSTEHFMRGGPAQSYGDVNDSQSLLRDVCFRTHPVIAGSPQSGSAQFSSALAYWFEMQSWEV